MTSRACLATFAVAAALRARSASEAAIFQVLVLLVVLHVIFGFFVVASVISGSLVLVFFVETLRILMQFGGIVQRWV